MYRLDVKAELARLGSDNNAWICRYLDINVKMLNVKVANVWLVELCLHVWWWDCNVDRRMQEQFGMMRSGIT